MPRPNFKILQQQAYEYIKDLILNQQIQYNQIYSESKIALEMGISRTPIRDAVHRLYQEGLIDIIPNKGFSLHKMDQRDVIETYEVRSAVECYCSRKAAINVQTEPVQELLKQLDISLKHQREILETDQNVSSFATEDQHFHYLLVSYSNNEALLELFSQYMYKIKKLACSSLQHEGRMEATVDEHQKIWNAIRDGNMQEAYDATLLHMEMPLGINLESVYDCAHEDLHKG